MFWYIIYIISLKKFRMSSHILEKIIKYRSFFGLESIILFNVQKLKGKYILHYTADNI